MNRDIHSAALAAIAGGLVAFCGCASMIVDSAMAKHGYHKATREQMLLPTKPSFPVPEAKSSIAALPREKIVGKWTTSYVTDTRVALLSQGYDGPTLTMTSHQIYWFFEDGTSRVLIAANGKETTWNGEWNYHDGCLTISGSGGDGKRHEMSMDVLWHDEDEFELRMDIPKYERMLRVGMVKSVECRYEPNGILHTRMILANSNGGRQFENATVMAQSPQICEREGEDE